MALVCAQAAIYAARNRAVITGCEHDQYDIKVQVRGNDRCRPSATPRARRRPRGGQGACHAVELRQRRGDPRRRRRQSAGRRRGRRPADGRQPRLQPYVDVAARFGLHVSSGLRPNSITANGNHSLHETGFAVDLSGAPGDMLRFAKYAAGTGAASSRSSSTRRWASGSRTASRSRSPSGAPPRTPSTSTMSTSPTPTRPTPTSTTPARRARKRRRRRRGRRRRRRRELGRRPGRVRPGGPPRALGRPGRPRPRHPRRARRLPRRTCARSSTTS